MKDRFDFEQDIFECWHVVTDIKQVYEMASDRGASTEDIANVLLGLHTMYEDRFHRLMDSFENLIINGGFAKSGSEDNPSRYDQLCEDKNFYEKRYTELLTKLRIISETDEIASKGVQKLLDESGAGGKPVGTLADDPAGTGFKLGQTFNTTI